MKEATTLPVSAQLDALLSDGPACVLPDHSDVLRAFNDEIVQLAASIGIAVPNTVAVSNVERAKNWSGFEISRGAETAQFGRNRT
jgi:hypothetical protein